MRHTPPRHRPLLVSLALIAAAGCGVKKPGIVNVETDAGAPASPDATLPADGGAGDRVPVTVSWGAVNRQPATWYTSAEAATVADDVIYYQNADGGWPKNIDIIARVAPRDRSTIDNSATTTELVFLALIYGATHNQIYLDAFDRGIDYLFAAQYPANGGWPQIYPSPTLAYQKHITYNDGAMVHVLTLLRDIANRANRPRYAFVDDARVAKAAAAVQAGIDCILKTQIVADGVKTGWCAQYDEVTLQPASARAYELVSNSGSEGAGVLEFLMEMDQPTPEIVDAVQAATTWFRKVQINGLRVSDIADATQPSGRDVVVSADPTAPPTWARFYEIGTDRPFFCGRDGIKKYTLAEIENERRTGYAWYGDWPEARFETYSTWQPRWAAGDNVLAPAADGGSNTAGDGEN